jgi:hypothetical protein
MANLAVRLICDDSSALSAVALLSEFAERTPQLVHGFLDAGGDLFQLVGIDLDRGLTPSAYEVRLRLEPSNRLAEFLAACGAGDVDAVSV